MNWDDIRLFVAIAEAGSFRQAAQQLNLGHATLSRRIESFEKRLGVKVFSRQTSGLSLTEAGKEILFTATPIADALDDLKVRLYGRDQSVKGKIKLTLPDYLSTHFVLPALETFQNDWPDVTFEIISNYKVLDLQNQEADIAIRSTNSPNDQLIGRYLGGMHQAAYASEKYLEQAKNNLQAHNWIRPIESLSFNATLFDQYTKEQGINSNLILFDIEAQLKAAQLGKGIAILPCLVGDRNSQLIRISPSYHRMDHWLLCHKDLRENKRMRLFREFIVNLFATNQTLITGLPLTLK